EQVGVLSFLALYAQAKLFCPPYTYAGVRNGATINPVRKRDFPLPGLRQGLGSGHPRART
ncbi:hypothetical protein, partial [Pseudomonas putida]